MTNRYHKLERLVRCEYIKFDILVFPKDFAIKELQHIYPLLSYKIWYLFDMGDITIHERLFMLKCNSWYYNYYKGRVGHIY